MSDQRMYCIFSKEAIKAMGGNRGKMASMAGHAFLHAWWDLEDKIYHDEDKHVLYMYKDSMMAKKVTLCVDTTAELKSLYAELEKVNLFTGLNKVVDRGLTVFDGPTFVCIGYGPISEEKVPDCLKNLKVLI